MRAWGLTLVLLAAMDARAQDAVRRVEALGGRLTLELPSGFEDHARAWGVMGAPESAQPMTPFALDEGAVLTRVFVTEVFATEGSDLLEGVRGVFARQTDVELAPSSGALHAVRVTPKKVTLTGNLALVDSLYVALPDRTVQRIDYYVNEAGLKELPAAQARAGALFSSVGPGTRALKLGVTPKNSDFVIDLPRDAAMTRQDGPDFTVYRVHWLDPLGAPQRTLGVYLGNWPSSSLDRVDPKPRVTTSRHAVFGKKPEWKTWIDPETDRPLTETVVQLSSHGVPQSTAQVWATAGAAGDFKAQLKAAKTLRLP